MAYNTYQAINADTIRLLQGLSIDESQWAKLNNLFGEALLDDGIKLRLIRGEYSLLAGHGIETRVQDFIRQINSRSLDDLARQLIYEFRS